MFSSHYSTSVELVVVCFSVLVLHFLFLLSACDLFSIPSFYFSQHFCSSFCSQLNPGWLSFILSLLCSVAQLSVLLLSPFLYCTLSCCCCCCHHPYVHLLYRPFERIAFCKINILQSLSDLPIFSYNVSSFPFSFFIFFPTCLIYFVE